MLNYVARSNEDGTRFVLLRAQWRCSLCDEGTIRYQQGFHLSCSHFWLQGGFCRSIGCALETLPDLISYARKNPGKLNIRVAESASSVILLAQMVGKQAGITWTPIPYGGDAKVVLALLSGTVDAAVFMVRTSRMYDKKNFGA